MYLVDFQIMCLDAQIQREPRFLYGFHGMYVDDILMLFVESFRPLDDTELPPSRILRTLSFSGFADSSGGVVA